MHLFITNDNWNAIADQHSTTGVVENIDKLMQFFALRCKRPGDFVSIESKNDYPILDVLNEAELDWYLKHLVGQGYLEQRGSAFGLTYKGRGSPCRTGGCRGDGWPVLCRDVVLARA